ncbi:MAG: riboflavin synthase, partial [Firmicutes bacterium]|nr:riboflavin synthase [Bacillota bacterium]
SIAVNGACLTVTALGGDSFTADVMAETLARTNLGELRPGDRVNLERALRLGDRLGGHLVTGHVDGVGVLLERRRQDISEVIAVQAPPEVLRYLVPKGAVAVDGVSLTVVDYDTGSFRVAIVPHTARHTTLGFKRPGAKVNLEADLIGKYVAKLLAPHGRTGGLDEHFLAEHGFL